MMLRKEFEASELEPYKVYRSTLDQGWKTIHVSSIWVIEPGGDYVRCLTTVGKNTLVADLRLTRKIADWFFKAYPGEQLSLSL